MSGYVESFRGHVLASECDLIGHMNVQFYNACISQAMTTMFGAIGLAPDEIKKRKRGFAAVAQDNKYMSELLAGDIMHMKSGILKTSSKSITFQHRLYNSATEELSFTSVLTAVYIDMEARKAIPLDDVILSSLDHLRIEGEA